MQYVWPLLALLVVVLFVKYKRDLKRQRDEL